MRILNGLEPADVWFWFEEICSIPRPSGHEERMADFLAEFAGERDLDWSRDGRNNVLIRKPGRGSAAGNPALALQAHVDIVPEKSGDSDHDFNTDPIIPVIRNDWVTAPKTTLGADNGIGVALMLAVLDSKDVSHPRLECVFTTDEERGLTGAAALDPDWITAGRLINLDSEDQGTFTIGCAGGTDCRLSMPLERSGDAPCSRLRVTGLRGGHSGIEIHKDRGNAIRFLARALSGISREVEIALGSMRGGSKRNAIPRDAEALILFPPEKTGKVKEVLTAVRSRLRTEYAGIEEELDLVLDEDTVRCSTLERKAGARAVDLLLALPHGVEKMSGVMDDLVETSVNLALLSMEGSELLVDLTIRSPLESARKALADRIAAAGRLAGAAFSSGGSYPGWIPDPDSEMLRKMTSIHRDMFGAPPRVESIHAGLECGIIGDRVGGLDMISIGPDIRDVHVPGERVSIPSLQRFWKFFRSVLEKLD
ncbi:MAG: aminoacyl-histidine dipeptidase [Candidatus Aegiribacteria sp.]